MTVFSKKPSLTNLSPESLFLGFAVVFFLAMTLKNPEISLTSAKSGLALCTAHIIPSLFPFMVVSEFLVTSGAVSFLEKLLGSPISRLFGISRAGSCAVLLGMLFGFPIGAKTAVSLYDSGLITKKEAERILAFCNIPSFGFLVSTVGVSLFSDRKFGFFLYISTVFVSLLIGISLRFFYPSEETLAPQKNTKIKINIGVETFTHAVSSACSATLSVCAYILFFSAWIGCFSHMLASFSAPPSLRAFLFGMFEISSGSKEIAQLLNRKLAAALCGFSVGWSGISVHFQIFSLAAKRDLSFRPYIVSKILQGVLCALSSLVYVSVCPLPPAASTQNVGLIRRDPLPSAIDILLCLFFLFSVLCLVRKKEAASAKAISIDKSYIL